MQIVNATFSQNPILDDDVTPGVYSTTYNQLRVSYPVDLFLCYGFSFVMFLQYHLNESSNKNTKFPLE